MSLINTTIGNIKDNKKLITKRIVRTKSDVVEFKFKAQSFIHEVSKSNQYWFEVIKSYFKLLYKTNDVEIVYKDLNDSSSINNIMPYTSNLCVSINLHEEGIAGFNIYGQNNCCGAMTTSGTWISKTYQNHRFGELLQYFKESIAYSRNISRLYCTDVYYEHLYEDMDPKEFRNIKPYMPNTKLLLKTGWSIIDMFKNKKSENIVAMYSKSLKNQNKEIIMSINLAKNSVVKIKNLTIGCDPELFLKSKETGKFVPSYNYIKGDKKAPTVITDQGHNIQCDNVMVEYGVPPSRTSEEFVKNNLIVQRYLKDKIAEPNNMDLVIFPYAEFTEENLKDEKANVFGCDPDFNVWKGGRPNIVGRPNPLGRSAGGHLHVGYDNHNQVTNDLIIKALDVFISIPLMFMEPENRRKEMYGKAGAYRPQPWGCEYRVTSNYIFSSPKLMEWAFNQITEAVNFINSNKGVLNFNVGNWGSIENIINQKNETQAKAIIDHFKIKLYQPELEVVEK